jgi:hypothetical protein
MAYRSDLKFQFKFLADDTDGGKEFMKNFLEKLINFYIDFLIT